LLVDLKEKKKYRFRSYKLSRGEYLAIFLISLVPILIFVAQRWFTGNMDGFDWSMTLLNFFYSLSMTSTMFFGCSWIMTNLEEWMPWLEVRIAKRILIEAFFLIAYSIIAQTGMIYLFGHLGLFDLNSGNFSSEYFGSVLLGTTIMLIVVSIYEGIFFFNEWRKSILEAERMRKEAMMTQLISLKNQVNPHFLFNSLSVLSNLIHSDVDKADRFITSFAGVYRYMLEMDSEILVSVERELAVLDKFLFLQQIRFEKGLIVRKKVDRDCSDLYIPPLTMQELLTNAIKHNRATEADPLVIDLICENGLLEISHPHRPRMERPASTGTGVANIKRKYELLTDEKISIGVEDARYIARIPLLDKPLFVNLQNTDEIEA
jgi:hypothetical protein